MPKLPLYYKAARHAWKDVEKARRKYHRLEIIRDKKMVLVGDKYLIPNADTSHEIVVFPRPDHVPVFRKAAEKLKVAGPSDRNPGAVGTISINNLRTKTSLRYAQAHYSSRTVSRSMITRYGGWRVRALAHAIKLAHGIGMPLEVFSYFHNNNERDTRQFDRDLQEACRRLGVKMERRKDGVPVVPFPDKAL